jgi:hypothetical protein
MSALWNLVRTDTSVSILLVATSALISMYAHRLTAVTASAAKA